MHDDDDGDEKRENMEKKKKDEVRRLNLVCGDRIMIQALMHHTDPLRRKWGTKM